MQTAFLNRIFVADPAERASFDQLVTDPWFTTETLELSALKADLSRRKAAVQAEKRREKEAEEAKRNAAAAAAAFDPFARDVTRAVGDAAEEDRTYADRAPAPPLPPTVASRYTFFYSRAHPAMLTERLEQAFSSMSAKYKTDDAKYKIKALVNTTAQQVGITARVYAHSSGMHVVDFARRQGDVFKFQEVYNVLCDALRELVAPPPSSTEEGDVTEAAAADEAKASEPTAPAGGDAEEDIVSAIAAAEQALAAAQAAAPGAGAGGAGAGAVGTSVDVLGSGGLL